jgi:septal ring factor EnvC (AmiA/AmiB activator)
VALNYGLPVQMIVKNVYLCRVSEELKNLILAVPVIGVLVFFVKHFMDDAKEERKTNKERDVKNEGRIEQDTKIMEGLSNNLKESNKKHDESNKKHDETNVKLDHIIRHIDK